MNDQQNLSRTLVTDRFWPPARQTVLYGAPIAETLPTALSELWANQTVLVFDAAASGADGVGAASAALLGERNEITVGDVRRNAPRADVLRIVQALRHRGTEAMVVVGGGSVIDAAKAARVCLTNNVASVADFERLRTTTTAAAPRPYMVAVPTTLSGAEFTPVAWVLDENAQCFQKIAHTDLAPDIVLLEPRVTLRTPVSLWLASGIGALGRAIEAWLPAPHLQPLASAACLRSIGLLSEGLRACRHAPEDLIARQISQEGAWLSGMVAAMGDQTALSERIVRQAGLRAGAEAATVTGALLPHMLSVFGRDGSDRAGPLAAALGHPEWPLSTCVAELVAELGLPTRLRDVLPSPDGMPEAVEIVGQGREAEALAEAINRAW
ncbi:iron-containing alcohol dehydrogenase [Pseudochelatococcus sp. B33]